MAVGAFKLAHDTIRLQMSGNTTTDIKVIPNVRVKAIIESSDERSAKVKVTYQKLAVDQTLRVLAVVWSTIDNPNMYSFSAGGSKFEIVTEQNLISGEMTFDITGLTAGKRYYIRAAATTTNPGNYYNYSNTMQKP